MKRAYIIITAILSLLLFSSMAFAADVTLQWDAFADHPEYGVRIYIGAESGNYTFSEDAGTGVSQVTIHQLLPGKTYYFAAKAYLNGMESGYSNEVEYIVPVELTILDPLPQIDDSVKTYTITIRRVQ